MNLNICHVNVGGKEFTFSRESFKQCHMEDTIVATTVLGKNNDQIPFFDVEPKIFKKYCAPFIRHGILPKKEVLTCPYEREHLFHVANIVGLIALAEYVENVIPKQLESCFLGDRKIKIGYRITISNNIYQATRFTVFDDFLHDKSFRKIHCPDVYCNLSHETESGPINPYVFLLHLMASPHNGKKEVIREHGSFEEGIIECEMREYRKLELVESGGYYELIHQFPVEDKKE